MLTYLLLTYLLGANLFRPVLIQTATEMVGGGFQCLLQPFTVV
jgi:hypothetical protein